MAIWQFSLYLIPRPKLQSLFPELPAHLDRDTWDEPDWWDTHQPSSEFEAVLDVVLPRMQNHWSKSTTAWGTYDGDRVEVSYEGGRVEEFFVRIDLRKPCLPFLEAICRVASLCDCLLLTEDMMLIEPRIDPLVVEIEQSNAFHFVRDPKGFFESFQGMPRME